MKQAFKKIQNIFRKRDRRFRAYTSFFRVMPDYIIIGAQRCGTTSLYNYLIQHPCIIPARKKEIHYYDNNYKKGIGWYKSSFPLFLHKNLIKFFKGFSITGEASPYYIFHPLVAKKINDALPGIKLICILRNPVDRAYSHYQHEVRKGRESLSFEEAISIESERLRGEVEAINKNPDYPGNNHRRFSYLARGRYEEQLRRWFKLFPKEQFIFIKSENLYSDSENQLNRVFRFLGLPDYSLKEYKKFGASEIKKNKVGKELKKKLVDHFSPYNRRLYSLLDQDFKWE